MYKLSIVALALASLAGTVVGNCGLVGIPSDTVYYPPISELTPGGVLLSELETYNLSSTTGVASPQYPYLKALRYSNGLYELHTEGIFPDFVTVERTTTLERGVNFVCLDGTTRRINFIFSIPDINNHPPKFNQESYSVTYELPLTPGKVINTGILVSDLDLELENADVHFQSSNKRFTPLVSRVTDGTTVEGHVYRVDLIVDENITEGEYSTLITADDGTFPVVAAASITVEPAGIPITEGTIASTVATTTTTTEGPPVTEGEH